MDGEIVIKARIELEQFEKDLKELDRMQIKDKKVNLEYNIEDLKKQNRELSKQQQELQDKMTAIGEGRLKEDYMKDPEWKKLSEQTASIQAQREPIVNQLTLEQQKLELLNNYVKENNIDLEEQKAIIENNTAEMQKQEQVVKETTVAQKELNREKKNYGENKQEPNPKKDIEDAEEGAKKTSSAFSSIGTIVGGLALAGLVSALGQAAENSETSKAQLEQMSTIINNIVYELGQLLLPIAEAIIDLLSQAVTFVASLLQDWFGIDLFTDRTSKSLNKGVKSAKALRKQLMGFDEMNILNDSGGTGALGGLGGTTKSGKKVGPDDYKKQWNEFEEEVQDWEDNHPATKAGLTVRNWILENIPGAKYIDEHYIEPLRRLLYRTGLFKPATEEDISNALGGGVVGAVTQKAVQDVTEKIKKQGFNKTILELAYGTKQQNEKIVSELTPTLTNFLTRVSGDRQTKIQEFLKTPWMKSMFGSDSEIDNKTGKVKSSMDNVANTSKTDATTTKTSWWTTATEIIKKYTDPSKNGVQGALTGAFNNVSNSAEKDTKGALEKIKQLIKGFNPPKPTVKVGIDQKSMDSAMKKIKEFFSKSITVTYKGTAGTVKGALGAKGLIINPPRLAVGGIINRPGKGVPLAGGGAIGGERGAEAVIPLTDSVQMERLGQAIARNIVVNLTNEVKLDGRQLSRYISQVMQDTQFSSNGGVM